MTRYAGETPQVRHWVKGYDGQQLTNVDVAVTITIWNREKTAILVNEAPMTWSATLESEPDEAGITQVGGWYYAWASPPGAPGSYLARCTATGGGTPAWEYKTIRLRADKAPTP